MNKELSLADLRRQSPFLHRRYPNEHRRHQENCALLFALFVLDAPFYIVLGYPVLSWLFPTYLLAIPVNYILWRTIRLPFSEKTAKPIELWEFLYGQGASFAFDIYAVRQQREQLRTKS